MLVARWRTARGADTATGSGHRCCVAADAADADVAGRRFTAWLAMLNDGKRDEIIAFRERELTEELRKKLPDPDEITRFRATTGGFDVVRVEDKTPTPTSVLIKERDSDQIARVVIEVEAAPPHRITKPTPSRRCAPSSTRRPPRTGSPARSPSRSRAS